ncbi:MAG: hypothetical protein HY056_13910 [Proteobacteria bacterium]|nr:hypothetical protein [Pseudomonadota bacterium]
MAFGVVFVAGHSAARADHAPRIVVPGKAGVPVLHWGDDISWAVVEGDWGLARAGQVPPTVIYRLDSAPLIAPPPGAYFPGTGQRPAYGRREVIPPANRALPPPAERFHREWGTQSDPTPANVDPTPYPPPVIVAPRFERHRPHPARP